MDNKTQITTALRAFINERPALVAADYDGITSYRKARREAARDRQDALKMLRVIELSAIGYAALREAFLVNDNRLECGLVGSSVRLEFTAGQNRATEFRVAAAMVCVRALWNHWAAQKPTATGSKELPLYEGRTLRGWITEQARRELGVAIATRWFN